MSVARGVGYPACRQTPYVALVVPAYGEICDMMCRSRVAYVIRRVDRPHTWRWLYRRENYVWLDPSRRVEILGNVQFIGEIMPKFRQKVSVFSKWARHRGDVRNSKGFATGFGKNSGRVLSTRGLDNLPIPLLDTRLGDLETPVTNTYHGKSCFLQIGSIEIVRHLEQFTIKK
ncbi:ubiquitin-specific protease 5 [Prunus dulcis]|uniref:Ubiquitin-specific protease 5 n=1 Tax=Prunus dulcis TaxID=3755 RepID=A0A5H2XKW6_PRUDU|nr:ubiquitin-specific protease 5 [Prunus dulcis]